MSGVASNCVMCGGLRRGPSRVCDSSVCQVGYRQRLQLGSKICVVCGRPLKPPHHASPVTCNSVECKRQAIALAQSSAKSCFICGIRIASGCQTSGACAEPYCQEQLTARQAAQRTQAVIEKRERLEDLAWATHLQASGSESSPAQKINESIVIVVPANIRRLSSPPPERVVILRENLTQLAKAVFADVHNPVCPSAPLLESRDRESTEALEAERADTTYDALVDQACSTCRGFCCFAGRNHAFLKHSDMRRTMRDKQLASVEALVSDYLSYLPEQSVEDSCLFHGPQGCGMPRRMRSDMCNTTLCPSLVNLYQKSNGQPLTQQYLFASTNVEDDLQTEPVVFQIKLASLRPWVA